MYAVQFMCTVILPTLDYRAYLAMLQDKPCAKVVSYSLNHAKHDEYVRSGLGAYGSPFHMAA